MNLRQVFMVSRIKRIISVANQIDIKRSSPLISASVQSSEGLVLRHSWHYAPRNLRSISHRTGETVQIFRSASLFLLQIHTDSLDLPHKRPSLSDIRSKRHIPSTLMSSCTGHHQKRSSLAAWCYSHQSAMVSLIASAL